MNMVCTDIRPFFLGLYSIDDNLATLVEMTQFSSGSDFSRWGGGRDKINKLF